MYLLALAVGLIVYGSLYPWSFAGIPESPLSVLLRSWPRASAYVVVDGLGNALVYVPLGVLVFQVARRLRPAFAIAEATAAGLALSTAMELLQAYVPGRVPSLADILLNTAGACAGALAAFRLTKTDAKLLRRIAAPVLLLACWIFYHLYPLQPSIGFNRWGFELNLWLHPHDFHWADLWRFAAEWLAVAMAVEAIFGRVRLAWLFMAFGFHLIWRPLFPEGPLVLAELCGVALAVALWAVLPRKLWAGPWLLLSAIVAREFVPAAVSAGVSSWMPFHEFAHGNRVEATDLLFRSTFDYGSVLLLWRNGFEKRHFPISEPRFAAFALTCLVALLAAVEIWAPGNDAFSISDPLLAVLIACALDWSTRDPRCGTTDQGSL